MNLDIKKLKSQYQLKIQPRVTILGSTPTALNVRKQLSGPK